MRNSYLNQENGISEREDNYLSPKKQYVEGCGFEGFDHTQFVPVHHENRGTNKFNIELHPASPDTEKTY